MFNLPMAQQYVIAPISLTIIMIILQFGEPYTVDWFGFYPNKIVNGDYWRLFIGQLLHTNLNHLMLNTGGVILIWALHGQYYRMKHYLTVLSIFLLFIGVFLIVFANYHHYAGLSGVLHAFFIYGAFIDLKNGEKTGWLLLIGVVVKVFYELVFGAAKETELLINANVAVESHLAGIIVGGLLGVIYILKTTQAVKQKA